MYCRGPDRSRKLHAVLPPDANANGAAHMRYHGWYCADTSRRRRMTIVMVDGRFHPGMSHLIL